MDDRRGREEYQALLTEKLIAWKPIDITPLQGGITNICFLVNCRIGKLIARFSHPDPEIIGINRGYEIRNLVKLASLDLAPEVLRHMTSESLLIYRWIEGRSMTGQELSSSVALSRAAAMLKRLHRSSAFGNRFRMIDLIENYQISLQNVGSRIPRVISKNLARLKEIAVLLDRDAQLVPCHNDAMPKNWIVQPNGELRLIDFEFSGNNYPDFDLATICLECNLSRERTQFLCREYYGHVDSAILSRIWLQMLLIDAGWGLFSLIQASSLRYLKAQFVALAQMRLKRLANRIQSYRVTESLDILSDG
jgi:thiamine kinase-like enzyme